MGVWSYPFQTLQKAKKFSSQMKKPWMAKVVKEDEGFYGWSAPDLGFVGSETLYGDDSLWDYLSETADKKKKDFDIRPYVEECLMYHLWYFEHQLETEFDPKALEIVHESLNLKFSKNDSTPSVNEIKNLVTILKENGVSVLSLNVYAQDPKLKWTQNNMPLGVPASHKTKKIFALEIFVDYKHPMEKILKNSFNILKILPYKSKSKTKGVGYVIFLEIKKSKERLKPSSKTKSNIKSNVKSENVKNQYKMTCTANGSNKFWNAKRVKNKFYLMFGPIGHEGRTTIKTFASEEKAVSFIAEKVKEKLNKKYKMI